MINISEEFINLTAPNESAVKNAMGLVKKKSFVKLLKTEDETLIFGECLGSGSSNYSCSVDFIKAENPVFRCSCPSRQIPCKHTLGLMYAYIGGGRFEISEIPKDILEKREKAEKREEKKKEGPSAPKKVNKTALTKKLAAQIEGLDLLERLVKDVVGRGFAAIDGKTLDMLEEQGRALNSSYLPGAQRMLRELILAFRNEDRERAYSEVLNIISTIYSLCKKGREHLKKRLQDTEMALDIESSIDELLGHAWQASELESAGLYEDNVELLQLFFNMYWEEARGEFIDLGYWIDLKSGQIHKTCNYRPLRAAKHIKEEDSFFSVAMVERLFIYPGDINRRVRWDAISMREASAEDCGRILNFAHGNYAEVIKNVKNTIKNPLSDKNPVVLLYYKKLWKTEKGYAAEDLQGKRIILKNATDNRETPSTHMLHLLGREDLQSGAMLVRFDHNLETSELTAQPLSVITASEIARLVY